MVNVKRNNACWFCYSSSSSSSSSLSHSQSCVGSLHCSQWSCSSGACSGHHWPAMHSPLLYAQSRQVTRQSLHTHAGQSEHGLLSVLGTKVSHPGHKTESGYLLLRQPLHRKAFFAPVALVQSTKHSSHPAAEHSRQKTIGSFWRSSSQLQCLQRRQRK